MTPDVAADPPIEPGEAVLRRISSTFYNSNLPVPVVRPAFAPNENDEDGISLYREQMISIAELVRAGKPGASYYVARFVVQELLNAGFTLAITKGRGELRGHVSINELNYSDFVANPKPSKALQNQLAEMACSRIVYRPGDPLPPTDLQPETSA